MTKYFTPTRLSENIRETPEGFLVCLSVPIGRTGEMIYGENETPIEADQKGKVIITREAKDLFSPNTIASFEGKPVTIGHPRNFVDPSNWGDLAKGVVQNVRRSSVKDDDGEESLIADLLITDSIAIGMIKRGLREVSCGYEAVYEQISEGKGRQLDIIGNHLALVEQGRAGPYYKINDQKERLAMQTFSDKMKKFFAKAIDEAEAMEKEEKKAGDKLEESATGPAVYDELVKMVKDLHEKMDSFMKPKDEAAPKEEEKAKDAEVAPGLEDRLKALEMAVAKIMEAESAEAEVMGDEDMEEKKAKDEEDEESEEMGDSDPYEMGDTAARAEILSPGIQITKNVKAQALKAAYATKDGKAVIESLTGGKKPAFDSAETVSHLFIATSEILKAKRGTGLEKTKSNKAFDSVSVSQVMSAEQLNERNKAFWSRK